MFRTSLNSLNVLSLVFRSWADPLGVPLLFFTLLFNHRHKILNERKMDDGDEWVRDEDNEIFWFRFLWDVSRSGTCFFFFSPPLSLDSHISLAPSLPPSPAIFLSLWYRRHGRGPGELSVSCHSIRLTHLWYVGVCVWYPGSGSVYVWLGVFA